MKPEKLLMLLFIGMVMGCIQEPVRTKPFVILSKQIWSNKVDYKCYDRYKRIIHIEQLIDTYNIGDTIK